MHIDNHLMGGFNWKECRERLHRVLVGDRMCCALLEFAQEITVQEMKGLFLTHDAVEVIATIDAKKKNVQRFHNLNIFLSFIYLWE